MDLLKLLPKHMRGSRSPADWGTHLSESKLISLTKAYLSGEGWAILEPWPWMRVLIRANRDTLWLNLVPIVEPQMRWSTIIRDVRERASSVDSPIGVLTLANVHKTDRAEAISGGTFIIQPSELPGVSETVVIANQQRRDLQRTSSAPDADA